MATTYTLISSVTVGAGGASSIDFTSIPADYTDLLVKISARSVYSGGGTAVINMRFNSSGGTAYSHRVLYGNGTSALSDNASSAAFILLGHLPGTTYTANTFSNIEAYIPNYTASQNKSVSVDSVIENNATLSYAEIIAGLWSNTSAITSVNLLPETGTGNFAQYSTAYLYGISNA